MKLRRVVRKGSSQHRNLKADGWYEIAKLVLHVSTLVLMGKEVADGRS